LVREVQKKLLKSNPDTITLAGSGEPTLHAKIHEVISSIKEITETKIAILTNGSLLCKGEIRQRLLEADIIMPTLCTASDRTFRMIHRPHPDLELNAIIDGLIGLRQDYGGLLFLEIVLLEGINDTEKELEGLKRLIEKINPEKIQLNTVVRPPADPAAKSLDRKSLEKIKVLFGKRAEIIAGRPFQPEKPERGAMVRDFLDMVKRRPLRTVDIAHSLGLSHDDVEDFVKGLLVKGYVSRREHSGETFYLINENDDHGQ
jgi:wyosine [tRNA(Phe)-imidazoG37] synthetase (radical SAM superfamily)